MSELTQTHLMTIQGEEFLFDYRRAMFWPKKKALILTDLHWGKTTFFRNHGIAISDHVLHADLYRLADLIKCYHPSTVLVLGDLIHHEKSLDDSLVEIIARFRHAYPCEFILIKGNHDRYTVFPETWGIVEENALEIGQFIFLHEHKRGQSKFQFSGHVHPMVTLRSGHDFMKLPAFIIKSSVCLLPAFSGFTGGKSLRLEKEDIAVVVYSEGLEVFK